MTHVSAMTPKRTGNHRICVLLKKGFFMTFSLMDLCARFRRQQGPPRPGGSTLTETPGDGKEALFPPATALILKIKNFLHRRAEKGLLFIYLLDII
jgi:hypothetical protein